MYQLCFIEIQVNSKIFPDSLEHYNFNSPGGKVIEKVFVKDFNFKKNRMFDSKMPKSKFPIHN